MKRSRLIVILMIIFTILAILPLGLFIFGIKTFLNTVEKAAPPQVLEENYEQKED